MDDGGNGRRRNLNLGGGICPTGGDIVVVVGVCGGSGGVDDCDTERSKAQQQKLVRWRDGNGGGSGGVSNCDPKRRMARQQKLMWRRDGNGSGGVDNCNLERRTAQ